MNSKLIAELAGVSRSTVSRVINGYPDISKVTRDKVLKIIEENNYIPNLSAQKLVGKKNRCIGVFLYTGTPSGENKKIAKSFFYSQLLGEMIDVANSLKYTILVSHINENDDSYRVPFLNKSIDAGIIIGGTIRLPEIEKLILEENKLLLIDYRDTIKSKNISIINPNNLNGGFLATKHLIKSNHRRIVHITGDLNRMPGKERLEGYKKAMKEYNISIEKTNILNGDFSEKSGYGVMKRYLKEKKKLDFTGIFAASDLMAIGAIRALKENGIKVPEEVSIIGFNNTIVGEYITPSLSTVEYLQSSLAEDAIETIIEMVEGGCGKVKTLDSKLVIRDSVIKI